jgi:hypothetical protein
MVLIEAGVIFDALGRDVDAETFPVGIEGQGIPMNRMGVSPMPS